MKHIFIINPAAGRYNQTQDYTNKIKAACESAHVEYEIAVSRWKGDCTALAHTYAQTGDEVRIYACGGDGTLNEVVCGVVGFDNASVTHFPGGSGNDFIRIFSDPTAFSQLPRLLEGAEARFDLITCGDHYALNVCSMGIDARVGTEVSRYKRWPLVSGSGAYMISTAVNLIRGIGQQMEVTVDGVHHDGNQSMVCVTSGRWYGGGFNPIPDAEPDDGLLDVVIVRGVSRLGAAKYIGKYKAGLYRDYPDIFFHARCREVTIRTAAPSPVNLDGELLIQAESTFRVLPGAIRFVYPAGLTWHVSDMSNQPKTKEFV